MCMRHIGICSLREFTILSHIISCKLRFSKNILLHIKCVFLFSSSCAALHVQYCRYYRWMLMKLEFSLHTFEKYSNIKLHENPTNGKRVVRCGQTDRHDEAHSRFFAILRTHLQTSQLMLYTGIIAVSRSKQNTPIWAERRICEF